MNLFGNKFPIRSLSQRSLGSGQRHARILPLEEKRTVIFSERRSNINGTNREPGRIIVWRKNEPYDEFTQSILRL